jgi:hypothetical protein
LSLSCNPSRWRSRAGRWRKPRRISRAAARQKRPIGSRSDLDWQGGRRVAKDHGSSPVACMILPAVLPRPPHPLQGIVHGLEIELLCMKRSTGPLPKALRIRMPRLKGCLQEFLIARRPAHVFW